MLNADDSKRALENLDHTEFQGREIAVEVSKRKKARGPTPGKYLGKFRRRRRHS